MKVLQDFQYCVMIVLNQNKMKTAVIIFKDTIINDEIVLNITEEKDGTISASTNLKKLKQLEEKRDLHFRLLAFFCSNLGGEITITNN